MQRRKSEKLYFMTLECDCNLTQGVSIFTPASRFYETLFTVNLPCKISFESLYCNSSNLFLFFDHFFSSDWANTLKTVSVVRFDRPIVVRKRIFSCSGNLSPTVLDRHYLKSPDTFI